VSAAREMQRHNGINSVAAVYGSLLYDTLLNDLSLVIVL
jgi:hypothetical protein